MPHQTASLAWERNANFKPSGGLSCHPPSSAGRRLHWVNVRQGRAGSVLWDNVAVKVIS